jgi:hypothetical protein
MAAYRRRKGVQAPLLLLLLCLGIVVGAAEVRQAAPRASGAPEDLEVLDDVLVSGEKPTRKVAELIPWLRRLIGEYSFGGFVDLGGKGIPADRVPVKGVGTCIGFGVAPGVQCEIHVRWPEVRGPNGEEVIGGVSALAPAMILYGLEPDEIGIRYLQVDNRGLAEGAIGLVTGDSAAFRTPCVDIPTDCQRVVRITARPESKTIDMQIDTELNLQVAVRFRFQLTRVAQVQAETPGVRR